MTIPFYNPCVDCGNEDIVLMNDESCQVSKAGGVRTICYKCGRNTKPQTWNEFNPPKIKGNTTDEDKKCT